MHIAAGKAAFRVRRDGGGGGEEVLGTADIEPGEGLHYDARMVAKARKNIPL
jgi:hypothetical protein